ncbi:hypothetical protein P154DRAFT_590742 [Amniculicola lignicola CBS 123094]|uniref:Uncharacterized protein n=1 Tax=Amniculicola lignicola CBS 123094 TaxID=1392246 RepID=A0A6A5WNI6_9PLEO|nr:hypothetical protein P154DRAFT_590742 [Amniculicola lignicola CBS 123094]
MDGGAYDGGREHGAAPRLRFPAHHHGHYARDRSSHTRRHWFTRSSPRTVLLKHFPSDPPDTPIQTLIHLSTSTPSDRVSQAAGAPHVSRRPRHRHHQPFHHELCRHLLSPPAVVPSRAGPHALSPFRGRPQLHAPAAAAALHIPPPSELSAQLTASLSRAAAAEAFAEEHPDPAHHPLPSLSVASRPPDLETSPRTPSSSIGTSAPAPATRASHPGPRRIGACIFSTTTLCCHCEPWRTDSSTVCGEPAGGACCHENGLT